MLKLLVIGAVCISTVSACSREPAPSSEVKKLGTNIAEDEQPYKVTAYPHRLSEALLTQFEILSASALSDKIRTLGLFRVTGLNSSGMVIGDAGRLSIDSIVIKKALNFVTLTGPVELDDSKGQIINYVDFRLNTFPIGFINSFGEVRALCDSAEHKVQYTSESVLQTVTFDCDINLNDVFEITVNKTDAEKKGETYKINAF